MRPSCLVSIALFALLIHAQQPSVQPATQKSSEMCTLEGRVIGAIKGEPVRKATLILSQADKPQGQRYSTTTGSGGSFAMQDIEPGKYRLLVMKGGYARMQYGSRSPGHPGTTLSLDPGQQMRDLIVRLTPQAVITGRVLDEDGEPVPWVSLQLFQYGYSRGKRQHQASDFAETNDLGEYRLFDLAPGRYFLSANPQVDMDQSASGRSYAATYYPGTADAAGATLLDVRPGMQLRGIDIPLVKTRTARLRGRVIFPAKGPPNQPANVELVPRDESRGFSSSASPNIDAQGAFEFRGVAPGTYFLMAHWSQGEKLFSALHAIDIRENDVENIVLELSPASELKGQVRVEGPVPEKLADFQVTLDPDGSGNMGWPSTQVHNDGSFTLGNVVAGQFQLHVQGSSENYYVKSARLGEKDILDSGIDASRGVSGAFDILLSSSGGQVEGVVLNAGEQPATGAAVVLVPERRSQWRLYKENTTDQYGRFHIKGIGPGEYKLFAWEDVESGAYEDPEFLKGFEALGERVSIREGSHESKELKLIVSGGKRAVN
jgi:protocatechuate 3,4-dioxygenase beta subunit